ncbi:MAG: hypothetical protein JKX85_13220 [Phycisphaeraceae bacterium]|nr:hypothetical protein [Phycisphaeraceae bacterium]
MSAGRLLLTHYKAKYHWEHIPGEYYESETKNRWAYDQGQPYVIYAMKFSSTPYRKNGSYHIRRSELHVKQFTFKQIDKSVFTRKSMNIPANAAVLDLIAGTLTSPGNTEGK